MGVVLSPKSAVWRGRGKPRVIVSERVLQLLAATYHTGKVGRISLTDDDLSADDIADLMTQLRCGAKNQGRRLRVQDDDDEIRFEMIDTPPKRAAA